MSSRRGVVLILSLLLIALALSVVGLLFIAVLFGGSAPPPVPANAALYLKIRAPWAEVEPSDVLSQFVRMPRTLRGTINIIKKAKADARIKTLVILPQTGGALWAQLQEVRAALVDFRTAGKSVTAYLEYGGAQEYYVASAADRILMMPAGSLDVSGLVTYELFFRGALDKLGVYPDLLHIGEYKTAANTFTEKGFTPAHREMSTSLNHDWYMQLVRAIAEGRKRSEADVIRAIDGGPYLAEEAKAAGLIDGLAYEDQIDDAPPVQGTRRMDDEAYERVPATTSAFSSSGRIALLYATGEITSGSSGLDGSTIGSDTFCQWIRKVRVDPSIRAIVIRIDSPGGSAIASEVIWRELMLTRDVKPVIVSMGDVAASGGYYIAVPAHTIVAEPGTITGSIGIVTGKFVLKETFEKLGIGTDAVSEGRMAEIGSPFRPFSKDERTRVEQQMRTTYDLFLSRVAESRHSTPAKIDTVARGRVWTGLQAHELGLVDELGGLEAAMRIAKQQAKLDPRKDAPLVVYPQPRSIFEIMANPFGASAESSFGLLTRRADARLLGAMASTLRLFRRGEPLAIMPNVFWR